MRVGPIVLNVGAKVYLSLIRIEISAAGEGWAVTQVLDSPINLLFRHLHVNGRDHWNRSIWHRRCRGHSKSHEDHRQNMARNPICSSKAREPCGEPCLSQPVIETARLGRNEVQE
jgi:hypothetical protein